MWRTPKTSSLWQRTQQLWNDFSFNHLYVFSWGQWQGMSFCCSRRRTLWSESGSTPFTRSSISWWEQMNTHTCLDIHSLNWSSRDLPDCWWDDVIHPDSVSPFFFFFNVIGIILKKGLGLTKVVMLCTKWSRIMEAKTGHWNEKQYFCYFNKPLDDRTFQFQQQMEIHNSISRG